MFDFLYTPDKNLSYNFLSWVYGIGSLIGLACFLVQSIFPDFESMDGFYVCFLPFLPCFIWSMIMSRSLLQDKKENKPKDD